MSAQLTVGIIGAGPVVQAIHLPTLARLTETFRVAKIMDVDQAVATEVAGRVDAVGVTDVNDIIGDPAIDVVAICSPSQFHSEQTIAALRAGKRAVLTEKPLAVSGEQAKQIAAVADETGVPLFVGAMHTFDPAWLDAQPYLDELRRGVRSIRSSIVLPPNNRFEDWATEVVQRPEMQIPTDFGPEMRAAMMPAVVLGLAIHDLPLVRSFLPEDEATVTAAEFIAPFGYAISVRAGDVVADVSGLMHGHWQPMWEFDVVSDSAHLHIDFTPSFVQAGSGTAVFTDESGTRRFGLQGHNGYEGEWRALAAAANGDLSLMPSRASLIDDLVLAVDIGDAAAALQLEGAQS